MHPCVGGATRDPAPSLLSLPQMKAFVPYMARKYDFDYE